MQIMESAIEAYERLRPQLLEPSDQNGSNLDRAILLRRGMLIWARERNPLIDSAVPVSNPIFPAVRLPSSGELATELVRLMASLILSSPKERYYAGTESRPLPSGA